jgi:uracil-DNA glycosylase
LGDGRPFTGPSGDRLLKWAGVESRDELLRYFRLANLFPTPLPQLENERRPSGTLKTKNFPKRVARMHAELFASRQDDYLRNQLSPSAYTDFHTLHNRVEVIVLGRKVWDAFDLPGTVPMFGRVVRARQGLKFYRFPHPSGLNHQMNDPEFVRETSERLRRIGCIITQATAS